jgi:hypothetical protein
VREFLSVLDKKGIGFGKEVSDYYYFQTRDKLKQAVKKE